MRAAAKAMVELLGGANRKGRGFLMVEGAAGLEFTPSFFQRCARVDDINDISLAE